MSSKVSHGANETRNDLHAFGYCPAVMENNRLNKAMKSPQLFLITLVVLQGAVSGCHSPSQSAQFSEVPDYMLSPPKPREGMTNLEIVGARPGLERTALGMGIRKAMGPSSDV